MKTGRVQLTPSWTLNETDVKPQRVRVNCSSPKEPPGLNNEICKLPKN